MATLALICALLMSAAVEAAPASTPHDLTGTWSCCGPGGAAAQTWTISSMDKASGAFSGIGLGGSIKMTITGTASGDSVTLTTAYDGSSYSATFKGTLSADSKSMAGSWESNSSQKGTWTATRPSAPTPGNDPGNPGNASDPNAPAGPGGTKAKAIPGEIYVTDGPANVGYGAVYKINPENGQSTLVHVGPPFAGVRGIAMGPEGNLFVTDIGAHAIHKIDLKAKTITTITSPLEPLLRAPWGIVYEPQIEEFLVTDSFLGTVVRVNPKTGVVKPLASEGGLGTPHGIALEPGGPAFVTDFKSHAVIRVAQTGGGWKASSFKKGPFVAPEGIAIATTAAGSRFYVAETVAPGGTSGATAPGGSGGLFSWLGAAVPELLVTPKTGGGVLASPTALAQSSDGETLYVGSTNGLPGTGAVVGMNLADGKLRILAGGFSAPSGIAVAPPKNVAVAVGTGKSPTTATPSGVTTTVTSPAQAVVASVAVVVKLPAGKSLIARTSKAVRVKPVQKPIPPGKTTKVRVPFKPALTKKIKAVLGTGSKVKAKITVKVTTANGASKKIAKQLRIGAG